MQINEIRFKLSEYKPQVLLVGNGILRNEDNPSWSDFLQKIAKEEIELKDYENIPYTILASAITYVSDKDRRSKFLSVLGETKYKENSLILELLDVPFDSILTTNYTYELEYHINNEYPKLKDKNKYAKYYKSENWAMLHTYNELGEKSIWHIHGEERRSTSIVLTHDEYARLTQKILNYLNTRSNAYYKYFNNLNFKSWIDYFIMGDIYILGQGFDFCEFDLWWLLSRRLREKATVGKVHFYDLEIKNNEMWIAKEKALKAMEVDVHTCDMSLENSQRENNKEYTNKKYQEFYKIAIEDIKNRVNKEKEKYNGNI